MLQHNAPSLEDALLNDFANRCFRHTADYDYIAARVCYRNGLVQQFHWQALQAIEKYFKAILLYNRIPAKNLQHHLLKALALLQKELPFELSLCESTTNLIKHLDGLGRFRYMELSYFTHGPKLYELDRAVWELRRYCRILDNEIKLKDGSSKNMLSMNLAAIKKSDLAQKKVNFLIPNGELEKIVNDKEHRSRPALIWKNLFFSLSNRKTLEMPTYMLAVNSPLYLHPEVIELVSEYVFIPGDVKKAYAEAAKKQEAP